ALLSDYKNLILTSHHLTDLPANTSTAANLEEALRRLRDEVEVFVLGGAQIFSAYLHLADRMYLTHVETTVPGADAFFPPVHWTNWKLTAARRHAPDEQHAYGFSICTYNRK
ncbi:MAG: dihydrofolate reductase, partial [Saprospiraceae bacterium]